MTKTPATLSSESWRRVAGVVEVALELDPATRAAYLETLGRQDEDLRRNVLTVLRSLGVVSTDEPAVQDVNPLAESGQEGRMGPWRTVRLLGRGGMGAVFLAERDDDEYQRQVAIKVIGGGFDAPMVYQRFLSERQILAGFDHPNIAKLFDAGTARDGRPYLVMEYIDGLPIDQYCFEKQLGVEQRLRLFLKVCAAVSYAHRSLVVHRDLKPSNILVSPDGEPKLLDFGIAKLLDPGSFPMQLEQTRTMQGPMTPNWASPEQLRREAISTSSDVYSLGLVLYHLLTGTLPFKGVQAFAGDSGDLSHRPSRRLAKQGEGDETGAWTEDRRPLVVRRLRGDLDNIVMKALRGESSRRYGSVESFSEDVERFLKGLPVTATRETPVYVFRKFSLRYRWQLTAAAIFLLAIISTAGVSLHQAEEVRRERDQTLIARELAEKQARLAERQASRAEDSLDFLSDLLRAADKTERLQQDLSVRDLLSEGLSRLEQGTVEASEARVDLLELIARAFSDFRDLKSAVRAQQLALETAVEHNLPEPEKTRLLASLALLQMTQGDQSGTGETCLAILQSDVEWSIRHSCLKALRTQASFEGDWREFARLARLSLEGVARVQEPGKGFAALIDVATLTDFGLLEADEGHALLENIGRTAIHELTPESARTVLEQVAEELLPLETAKQDMSAAARIRAWLEAHRRQSHQHDTVAGNALLPVASSLRESGRYEEALETLDAIDRIGKKMVELEPDSLRGRWLLAAAAGFRGKVWQDIGQQRRAQSEYERSAEGFRILYEESGNFFARREYTMILMLAGHAEEARPHVDELIEKGFRSTRFLVLADGLGLLPDPMPPAIEFDSSIPPALQARFDAARNVRLPWEAGTGDWPAAESEENPAGGSE